MAQPNRILHVIRPAYYFLEPAQGPDFMLFMIIEQYRGGNPVPVYRRLRDVGRSIPDGLSYVASWVTEDLGRCYQVMETERRELVDQWIAQWTDLVEFEVHPILTSAEAQAAVEPRL